MLVIYLTENVVTANTERNVIKRLEGATIVLNVRHIIDDAQRNSPVRRGESLLWLIV